MGTKLAAVHSICQPASVAFSAMSGEQNALAYKGLRVHRVMADGNCLFRSVSHQLYGDEDRHRQVRESCLRYMESHRQEFERFIDGDFDQHLRDMRRETSGPRMWGGHPEAMAISCEHNRPVEVYQTINGRLHTLTLDRTDGRARRLRAPVSPIRIFFSGEHEHYNSVVDMPHADHREPVVFEVEKDSQTKKTERRAFALSVLRFTSEALSDELAECIDEHERSRRELIETENELWSEVARYEQWCEEKEHSEFKWTFDEPMETSIQSQATLSEKVSFLQEKLNASAKAVSGAAANQERLRRGLKSGEQISDPDVRIVIKAVMASIGKLLEEDER